MRGLLMLLVATILLAIPSLSANPSGIGQEANNGCLCHGILDESTTVGIEGLPERWQANTNYPLNISVVNDGISAEENNSGGFRLTVSTGNITYDETEVQFLDSGYTHTANGNSQRSWQVNWTSPSDATKTAHFTIHGNAVNGDDSNNGDAWSSQEYSVAGIDASEVEERPISIDLSEAIILGVIFVAIAFLFKMMYSSTE